MNIDLGLMIARNILKINELLRENYVYIDKIDKNILKNIKYEYDSIKSLSDMLNQYK